MILAIIKTQWGLFCLLWIHIPTTLTGDLCAKHCDRDTHYIVSTSQEESREGWAGGLGCQAGRQKGKFCGGHSSVSSSFVTE